MAPPTLSFYRSLAKLAVQIFADFLPENVPMDAAYVYTETPDNEPPGLQGAAKLLRERTEIPLLLLYGGEQECGGTRPGNVTVFHGFTGTRRNLLAEIARVEGESRENQNGKSGHTKLGVASSVTQNHLSKSGPTSRPEEENGILSRTSILPWPFRCGADNMTHTLNEARELLTNIQTWNSLLGDHPRPGPSCSEVQERGERDDGKQGKCSVASTTRPAISRKETEKDFAWRKGKLVELLERTRHRSSTSTASRSSPQISREIRNLVIIAPTIHLLRAFVTTVSVLIEKNMTDSVNVFAYPGTATDWEGSVVHSQGITTGTRSALLDGELDRIARYHEKGDLVDPNAVLEYLQMSRSRL
ncbi:unnamed protein product [Amoebophrya sp. A120]|nr:unnamed protein product [Amoebophrya sp. A120]|eukprot:GSA120T00011556001.1